VRPYLENIHHKKGLVEWLLFVPEGQALPSQGLMDRPFTSLTAGVPSWPLAVVSVLHNPCPDPRQGIQKNCKNIASVSTGFPNLIPKLPNFQPGTQGPLSGLLISVVLLLFVGLASFEPAP
jgi:hypothetical protein